MEKSYTTTNRVLVTSTEMQADCENAFGTDRKIRISVKKEFAESKYKPGQQVITGVHVIATHRGKKWGIAKMYSQWEQKDGTQKGEYYECYNLNSESEEKYFRTLEEICR